MKLVLLLVIALIPAVCGIAFAAYQGTELLGDKDTLRQTNLPYDLLKQNSIGINYMENLLDGRSNIVSYTHLNFNSNAADGWHLQFPDDAARFLEGLALEADYSPVVRLELARRIAKGIVATHVHGTTGLYGFRVRYGGKTNLLLDTEGDGWASLCYLGDSMEPGVSIGFEAVKGGAVYPIGDFTWSDPGDRNGSMGRARSSEYWNETRYVWKRDYKAPSGTVKADFTSWMSDEYMPMEINWNTGSFDKIVTLFGKGKGGMKIFSSVTGPARVFLPDRKTVYASDRDGDVVIDKPDFNYIIMTKTPGWANRGYAGAVVILWEGKAEKLELLAEDGYGQIRLTNAPGKKSWISYTKWMDPDEMDYMFRNADHFLKQGSFLPTDVPMPENNNADYTGLAAAAYMLTKWHDPCASTLLCHAERAVDAVMKGFPDKHFVRAFFPVRACCWMILTAKELKDADMEAKYTAYLETAMEKLWMYGYHPEYGGWNGTWDHWNCVRALFMAWKATGGEEYYQKWEKALSQVKVDETGMYVNGQIKKSPADVNTYFGAMPMGAWGAAGWRDMCETYMHLDVPANENNDSVLVKDLWNDAGAGPWAQDDANPEFVGYCLAGIDMPYEDKYMVPVGSFASYDDLGNVTLRNEPLVDNPFFRPGNERFRLLKGGLPEDRKIYTAVPVQDKKGVYEIDAKNARSGLALEADVRGGAYRVSASPDGKKWHMLYDTVNTGDYRTGVDLSAFVGNRDLYLKTDRFYGDKKPAREKGTRTENRYRFVAPGGEMVYRLPVAGLVSAFAEVICGNNYVIELSGDGESWDRAADSNYYASGKENVAGGWLRLVDLDPYLGKDSVYMRVTCLDRKEYANPLVSYPGTAFLERCTLYGVYDTDKIYVKIEASEGKAEVKDTLCKYW
ncbi:MAG: hypothetical protein J5758_01740 [Abditibacteriota bacterium]|nr:hypothetical protein [Abditibacteriota bacterium]